MPIDRLAWPVAAILSVAAGSALAQSIEPRSLSAAPTGVNFALVGYSFTSGGLSFDPAIPIDDASLRIHGPAFAYARTFGLIGRPAKVDVILPVGVLSGDATFNGDPVRRDVSGIFDPLFRLSVIFTGAKAMTPAEFRNYNPDLTVGASVQVSAPLGQYDATRIVNLGSNRWFVKPEIGVAKRSGPWNFELKGAATFYTANADFFGATTRSQKPLLQAQAHVIHNWASGVWLSVDGGYLWGGRTTVDGIADNNLQSNWRAGATLAVPVDRRQSIKLFASTGVSSRTGNGYDLAGVLWQYRWGSGL